MLNWFAFALACHSSVKVCVLVTRVHIHPIVCVSGGASCGWFFLVQCWLLVFIPFYFILFFLERRMCAVLARWRA